jgi:alpha/beta superfamily hydrolase
VQRLVLIAPAARNFVLAPVPQDSIVVHGEADDVVPLQAVLDWARPQVLPVTVVPATGHFFHGQLALLKQLIVGAWH